MKKAEKSIIDGFIKYVKNTKVIPSTTDLSKTGIKKHNIKYYFGNYSNLIKFCKEKYPSIFKKVQKKAPEKKNEILEKVCDFVKENKKSPTGPDLRRLGISQSVWAYHFGTLVALKELCREKYPDVFKNIVDESLFTKKNYDKLKNEAKDYRRFVITSAVTGCKVHKRFLKSLLNYCKKKDAMLLVIPITDPAAKAGWNLDPLIGKAASAGLLSLAFSDLELNKSIFLSSIKMSSKQIDPTTGLDRIAKDRSFIYGSPKQRLKFIANSRANYPHAVMGTGAITLSNYESDRYMSKRTAYLATHDHKIGALIVEIKDKTIYHFRQIQAEPGTGNFIDLGNYYKPNSSREKLDAELIKLGDWHAGDTCPVTVKAWLELCKKVKPKYLILEDVFDGKSINHHEAKKVISQSIKANEKRRNLEEELKLVARDLKELVKLPKDKVVITYSNHDDFLLRWLESGEWVKDHENFAVATELARVTLQGEMPLQHGVEKYLDDKTKKKIRWLRQDESWQVNGIEQGAHGHLGSDGARGSLAGLEKAYGAGNFAHRHSPAILRDAWQAGTSTKLELGYNKGASSWLNASIVQYPNGGRQIINAINGRWRLREKDEKGKK